MQNLKNALEEALKLTESVPAGVRKDEIKKGISVAISEIALLELEAKSPAVKPSETRLIREAVAPFIKTNAMGQKILDGVAYRGDIPMQVIKQFHSKINSGKIAAITSETSEAKVDVSEGKSESLPAALVSSDEEQELDEAEERAYKAHIEEKKRAEALAEAKPAKSKPKVEAKSVMTMEEDVEAAILVIMKAKTAEAAAKKRNISEAIIAAIAETYGVLPASEERTRANVLSDIWTVLHNS